PAAGATSAVCERCSRRARRRSGHSCPASARPRGSAGQIVWSVGSWGLVPSAPMGRRRLALPARAGNGCPRSCSRSSTAAASALVARAVNVSPGVQYTALRARSSTSGSSDTPTVIARAERGASRRAADPVEEGGNTAARGSSPNVLLRRGRMARLLSDHLAGEGAIVGGAAAARVVLGDGLPERRTLREAHVLADDRAADQVAEVSAQAPHHLG